MRAQFCHIYIHIYTYMYVKQHVIFIQELMVIAALTRWTCYSYGGSCDHLFLSPENKQHHGRKTFLCSVSNEASWFLDLENWNQDFQEKLWEWTWWTRLCWPDSGETSPTHLFDLRYFNMFRCRTCPLMSRSWTSHCLLTWWEASHSDDKDENPTGAQRREITWKKWKKNRAAWTGGSTLSDGERWKVPGYYI